MTDQPLYLAIGVPIVFNGLLITMLIFYINARFDGLRDYMNERFSAMNQRFDDMRDLWRAELHRVEEVIDVRLKHLEER